MRSLLFFGLFLPVCLGAKILGINPTASYSHQVPFLIVMQELAKRGHDVTVVTTDPLKNPPVNFTQIDVSFSYEKQKEIMKHATKGLNIIETFNIMESITENQLQSSQIQHLMKSEEKYDLVVMEMFVGWCYLGLVHNLGSPPVVGFLSASATFVSELMGNRLNPSYVPWCLTSHTDHMSFTERIVNTYEALKYEYEFHTKILPPEDKLMRKYFGDKIPSIWDMVYNVSLMIGCNDFVLGYPVPTTPNIVEVTGLNVQKERKPLPKEIKAFLDDAEHGVVYMSLGSNVKSKDLPEMTRRALLKAFSSLPQRVLWKFEDDSLPGKPDNVMVAKWLPQQDVLAHPKVRLFVTQGGLQSLSEATYFGVPLVGMPFFGDQFYNVAKMKASGIGTQLNFNEITNEHTVLRALKTVLENPSYAINMRRLSSIYREHQEVSLDRAAWWIEYVIRHNGAKHLRPASLDLAWYQLLLLDVAVFVVAAGSAVLFIIYQLIKVIGRKLLRRQDPKIKAQ